MNLHKCNLLILLTFMLAACASVEKTDVPQSVEKRQILLPAEKQVTKRLPVETPKVTQPIVKPEQSVSRPAPVIKKPQPIEKVEKSPVPAVSPRPQPIQKPPVVTAPPVKKPQPPQSKKPSYSSNYEQVKATWYSVQEHGKKTASGDVYDLYGMTAAHASLPLSSKVKVRNIHTGRSIIVTINDRLSTQDESVIKLSYHAARKLNLLKKSNPAVELIPMR